MNPTARDLAEGESVAAATPCVRLGATLWVDLEQKLKDSRSGLLVSGLIYLATNIFRDINTSRARLLVPSSIVGRERVIHQAQITPLPDIGVPICRFGNASTRPRRLPRVEMLKSILVFPIDSSPALPGAHPPAHAPMPRRKTYPLRFAPTHRVLPTRGGQKGQGRRCHNHPSSKVRHHVVN